jgi:uncharacterized membrane protein
MIDLVTLAKGDASRIVDRQRIVARTEDAWRRLWVLHSGPDAPPPVVDFSTHIVAAAFAGERPTAGYRIEIQAAVPDAAGVRLVVQDQAPPRGAIVAQVLTSPFHIVLLPASAGEIGWSEPGSGDETTTLAGPRPSDPTSERVAAPGIAPRQAAVLAYLAGPLSGALILLTEPRDADVRFHAWQSIIALGGLVALMALGYLLAAASLFFAAGAVSFFVRMSAVLWIATLVVCGVCVWKASRGGRWKLPLAGDLADRIANPSSLIPNP